MSQRLAAATETHAMRDTQRSIEWRRLAVYSFTSRRVSAGTPANRLTLILIVPAAVSVVLAA
jgi:hypothetical protein